LQLFEFGVPFMVFEMARAEYRILKTLKKHVKEIVQRLARALKPYTPGMESVSPFRFNPLRRLAGIGRDEHIETILNCFKAAFPMSGPLPALLAEALELAYEEHPDPDDPPVMADLYAAARTVLEGKDYFAVAELRAVGVAIIIIDQLPSAPPSQTHVRRRPPRCGRGPC